MPRANPALKAALAETEEQRATIEGLRQTIEELRHAVAKQTVIAAPIIPSIVDPTKPIVIARQPTQAEMDADEFNWEAWRSRQPIRDQIAANKAPVKPVETLPPGVTPHPFDGGWIEGKTGKRWTPDADTRPYLERRLEAKAQREADDKAELAAMKAGLEPGQIKVWDGLLRDERTGKIIPVKPAVLGPQDYPTENSAPDLLAPQPEQIAAGQSPDALTDEVAELMKLRRPDPVPVANPPHPIESPDRPNRSDEGDVPERPKSLRELLEPLARH